VSLLAAERGKRVVDRVDQERFLLIRTALFE
jgi:hypothetical protein